jgi:hypothetical protein
VDAHQQALLQSTHDSTIRQEQMIAQMQLQLNEGQLRFKAIDLRFEAIGVEITSLRQITEPTRQARKLFGRFIWLLIAAISYPAAAWIWETISKMKSQSHP